MSSNGRRRGETRRLEDADAPPAEAGTTYAAADYAFVGLGSNLGERVVLLRSACDRLSGLSDHPILISSFLETAPVDCPPGSPNFLNAVAGLLPRAGQTPEEWLAALKQLEAEFGRAPKRVMNEARPLDLDLLYFAGETRSSAELVLPHPRAHLRRFVLEPLAELAPDLVWPGQNRTVRTLLEEMRKR